jgi:hypothetical protein
VDKADQPVPFANIASKILMREQLLRWWSFYIESVKTYGTLVVTSVGFLDREITLGKAVSYNFKVLLREAEILNEVVIFTGKHQNRQPCSGDSKKNMGKKTQKRFVFV